MVEPIEFDSPRARSNVTAEFGSDVGLTGRRAGRFLRKADDSIQSNNKKYDDDFSNGNSLDNPPRSFMRKTQIESSSVSSPIRSRPESPLAENSSLAAMEERRKMRSNESIPSEVARELPSRKLSSDYLKESSHHKSNESLKGETSSHLQSEARRASTSSGHHQATAVHHETVNVARHVSPREIHQARPEQASSNQEHHSQQPPHESVENRHYPSTASHNDTRNHRVIFDDKKPSLAETHPVVHNPETHSNDSHNKQVSTSKPPVAKLRPKSSSLWEKIKRREQRDQQIRERGFFEHAPPDFVDMSSEPDYGGDRDPFVPNDYPKRRTLYYSKKGGDGSYIDVVAEVQKDDGAYVDVQPYDEPVEPKATLSLKYGRAMRMGGSAREPPRYSRDDSTLEYSTITNTKELRQVVYGDWLSKKAALVRAEQKRKENLKKEEARQMEEEYKNKLMASKASFLQWRKEKDETWNKIKEREKERQLKEAEAAKKKRATQEKSKQYIKAWTSERPKTAVDQEKLAIERRRRQREEKQRMDEEKKKKDELSEKAFLKWKEEKQEQIKKQVIEAQKQRKVEKAAEFNKRLERDQLAVQSYEQWLESKEKQMTDVSRTRRASSAIGGSMGRLSSRSDFIDERPPWFPASRTIARPLVRLT